MDKKYFIYGLMAIFSIVISGCSDDVSDVDSTRGEYRHFAISSDQKKIVDKSNENTINILVNDMGQERGDLRNTCVSSYGSYSVLSILANGSRSESRDLVLDYLGYGKDGDLELLNSAIQGLGMSLSELDPAVKFRSDNSIWYDKSLIPTSLFTNVADKYYNGDLNITQMYEEKGRTDINRWVEEKTFGEIKEIFNNPPDMKAIFINSTYFKGSWSEKFDKNLTIKEKFHNSDGSESEVMMMNNPEWGLYYMEDDKATCVSLPYGHGNYCMDIILPKESVKLDEYLKGFSYEKYRQIVYSEKGGVSSVDIKLPRFSVEKIINLYSGFAEAMAIKTESLLFPGLFEDCDIAVDQIKQNVSLHVDEDGTKAAVTTVAGAVISPGNIKKEVHINHPFIYFIRERSTGVIILTGYVCSL